MTCHRPCSQRSYSTIVHIRGCDGELDLKCEHELKWKITSYIKTSTRSKLDDVHVSAMLICYIERKKYWWIIYEGDIDQYLNENREKVFIYMIQSRDHDI